MHERDPSVTGIWKRKHKRQEEASFGRVFEISVQTAMFPEKREMGKRHIKGDARKKGVVLPAVLISL